MLLGAFGVCACLALPLAIHKIMDINNAEVDVKIERRDKERVASLLVDGQLPHRVEALYNCLSHKEDELSFVTGEIIAVTGMSVIGIYGVFIICVIGQRYGWDEWWEGHIESQPHRRGFFHKWYVKSIEKSETSSPSQPFFPS